MNSELLSYEKLNNKGFSLTEVIVCLAILIAVAAPLVQAFSMGAKVNAKAQSMQNATSIAESVMEEIKGSTIPQLESKYAANTGEGKTVSDLIDETTMKEDKAKVLGVTSYAEGKLVSGKSSVVIKESDGLYAFFKQNETSDAGEEYDVVATIDARESYNIAAAGNAAGANNVELPILESIDTGKNVALSTEINKYDESAGATLKDLFYDKERDAFVTPAPGGSLDVTISDREKNITVTTTETASATTISCDVEYKAKIKTTTSPEVPVSFTKNVYLATFDSTPSIYIFYKSMQDYVETNGITLQHPNAYMFSTEKISFVNKDGSGGNITTGCKHYLVMNDQYHKDGTVYKYPDTSTPKSYLSLANAPGNLRIYIGGSEHIYDKKKDDYVYEIKVMVTKKDGTVAALITSTKNNK